MAKIDFSDLRIPCSLVPVIMGDYRVLLTDKQQDEMQVLMSKEKLTVRQKDRLAELQAKKEGMSQPIPEAAKTELLTIFNEAVYGKRYKPVLKAPVAQMERGKSSERNAASLIMEVWGMAIFKDKSLKQNDYLKCNIDAINAPTIEQATKILEIKSSYDLIEFNKKLKYQPSKNEYLQTQAMLAVTGKNEAEIVHVLTEFTESELEAQKAILFNKMCPDNQVTDKFIAAWNHAEKCLRFLDVPKRNRIFSHLIRRDNELIGKIYRRVEDCRKWLNAYRDEYDGFFKERYASQQ